MNMGLPSYPEILSEADKVEDKERRIDAKFKLLHQITELQDKVNLNIRAEVDNSEDPRWFPIHIIDDANAVILEASQYGGMPGFLCPEGSYFRTKAKNLDEKVWEYVHYECKKQKMDKLCDKMAGCMNGK